MTESELLRIALEEERAENLRLRKKVERLNRELGILGIKLAGERKDRKKWQRQALSTLQESFR